MTYSNALSMFILHHDINRLCDKNFHLIQYLMRTSHPVRDKFISVCKDFKICHHSPRVPYRANFN